MTHSTNWVIILRTGITLNSQKYFKQPEANVLILVMINCITTLDNLFF